MFTRKMALAFLAAGLLLGTAGGQSISNIPRVGFLAPQGRSLPLLDAFQKGLADLGYIDGKDLIVEARFAEGQYDRFPALLSELVNAKVKVLVVTGAVTARAAKKQVSDVPLVFTMVVDPVADNVVSSLERPGGTITGVTTFDPQQATKQLQLLKEVLPKLQRVAVLGDQGVSEALIKASVEQARAMGLEPLPLRVSGPNPDFAAAFTTLQQQHADALLVLEEPVLGVHANQIAELASQNHLPTMFAPSRVGAGGLLSYGTSQTEGLRRMATYVDKILRGAKAGEMPVEVVNRYELIVNQKTAKAIGIAIPDSVLKRADKVIE